MLGTRGTALPDLNGLTVEDWLGGLEDFAEQAGYYEPLGARHAVAFVDHAPIGGQGRDEGQAPVLLVTFETVADARADKNLALPFGLQVAEDGNGNGDFSRLTLLAKSHDWFRDPAVYSYFDRLVDGGFFDEFERVVFYGAGMCGYAAAAFSVAAPGSTVIVISPQATLDPRVAEWDHRHTGKRHLNFNDRYGYAPDMIEAADQAYVLYDPEEDEDAMHAALFLRENVTRLRCRGSGRRPEADLIAMRVLQPMLTEACAGRFNLARFHVLYRRRREYLPYLRSLLRRIDDDGRLGLARMLCRNVVGRMRAPAFRRRLQALDAERRPETLSEPAE